MRERLPVPRSSCSCVMEFTDSIYIYWFYIATVLRAGALSHRHSLSAKAKVSMLYFREEFIS